MSSHLHLRKFSFFPGPLHHGFFEDLLMMAIQTLVMWALVVVLICMSLRTGEFVHHFMCSFLFLISGNKLTYWSWFLDSRPGVKIFFFFITYFRTFSDRRYHLQLCSPCEYCVPIGYWFWSCCFGKRLQGGRISSCPTLQFSSVHLLSRVGLFETPWTAALQASLSIANSQSLLKFMFIESMMPSNCLILCHRLLFLPSIFPRIRVFSKESVLCIRLPKYWSYSISSFNEYSGLMSFRIDCLISLLSKGLSRVFSNTTV